MPTEYSEGMSEFGPVSGKLPNVRDSLPDDIRAMGWSVAVHNDYWIGAERWTFWLFSKDNQCVKGEGKTDAEALDEVRRQISEF